MALLNIQKRMDEGVWKQYDDDVSFKIRPLTGDLVKTTKRNNTASKVIGGKAVEEINDEKWDKDLFNSIVEDWKGIIGNDGQLLECNQENKTILRKNFIDIVNWIMDTSRKLALEVAEVKEAVEKN